MLVRKFKFLNYALLVLSMSCVDSYHPSLNNDDVDIMVINGFINASDQSASVNLSHANSIANVNQPLPETNATVTITEENGSSFILTEREPGNYLAEGISINLKSTYQLQVLTTSGNRYLSDNVGIDATPPIDSISWESNNDGIILMANTHDQTNNTKYFKWNFVETWAYRSVFASEFMMVNREPIRRGKKDLIDLCFRTIPSTKIYLGTTERLTQSIISRYPLLSIEKGNVKLSLRYSIMVTQRALGKQEYTYLQQLQRTTETIGSLFDPQPSPIGGNIHNAQDASIPVIGYFSGALVHKKRIFIAFEDLPLDLRVLPLPGDCNVLDTVCVKKPGPPGIYCKYDLENLEGDPIIVGAIYDDEFKIIAYTDTSTDCGDCRTHGGTVERPDFW